MAGRNLGIDVVAVIGAVAGDGRHCPLDPVEQGTDLRAVIGILVGQHRGDDPAGIGDLSQPDLQQSRRDTRFRGTGAFVTALSTARALCQNSETNRDLFIPASCTT